MTDLPIYPADVPRENWPDLPHTTACPFAGAEDWSEVYATSGRELLARLLSALQLRRDEQIAILTTSNDTYVSTCVSITAFNFSGISQVVTEKTRVVVIIHEFGRIYPDLVSFCTKLRERGMIIIEDCAHVLGGIVARNVTVGSVGDYALFSLPKVLPLRRGGLLRQAPYAPLIIGLKELRSDNCTQVRCDFMETLPYWEAINALRRRRYRILSDRIGIGSVGKVSERDVPWMVSVVGWNVPTKLKMTVQFGATLRTNSLLIPTNPFVKESTFLRVADALVKNENCRKGFDS